MGGEGMGGEGGMGGREVGREGGEEGGWDVGRQGGREEGGMEGTSRCIAMRRNVLFDRWMAIIIMAWPGCISHGMGA